MLAESASMRVSINLKPAYFELRQVMHDMRDRVGLYDLATPSMTCNNMRPESCACHSIGRTITRCFCAPVVGPTLISTGVSKCGRF